MTNAPMVTAEPSAAAPTICPRDLAQKEPAVLSAHPPHHDQTPRMLTLRDVVACGVSSDHVFAISIMYKAQP
jgi:hypothetical protein